MDTYGNLYKLPMVGSFPRPMSSSSFSVIHKGAPGTTNSNDVEVALFREKLLFNSNLSQLQAQTFGFQQTMFPAFSAQFYSGNSLFNMPHAQPTTGFLPPDQRSLPHLLSAPCFSVESESDRKRRRSDIVPPSKLCRQSGCHKYAQGGTKYCVSHGGGKRCQVPGCHTGARGNTLLCIKHGGGKRCSQTNCSRSAIGRSGLCVRHGGGKRCRVHDCGKAAQGATSYCVRHGKEQTGSSTVGAPTNLNNMKDE